MTDGDRVRDGIVEGVSTSRSQSARENVSQSLATWRDDFAGVPNWAIQAFNGLMVVAGVWLAWSFSGLLVLVGIIVALSGALGILDRVYREVNQRWR